ncbi:unnamed protein product [Clavelina lepadiformis]|uniref:BAG family molecular chaperone regulator 1 n=1 Tax=Clavelina lepadiformis TaxID=159417 RepID=A0ABP0GW88_CLALP
MELTISVGATRHKVTASLEATVQELMHIVEDKSEIPEHRQKLIFKGVTLTKDPDKLLSKSGIKSGSKIMVVGKRYNPDEEEALNKFQSIERDVSKTGQLIADIEKHVDSILKGFMDQKHKAEAFQKIEKEILAHSHSLMKHLENIDSMTIVSDFKDARIKRKVVVDKIQKHLDKCDFALHLIDNEQK